jgi:nucleotide-binding universal stress UspA family protein
MLVIVVGVDGSAAGAAALAAAARLSAATGCDVVAVHVTSVPAAVHATLAPLVSGAAATANDELADRCHLECELALAGTGVAWTFELRHGDPATQLTRAADEHDAACVVVGRDGHRVLARLRLGSVTDRLVHHASCPVLVVPPTDP